MPNVEVRYGQLQFKAMVPQIIVYFSIRFSIHVIFRLTHFVGRSWWLCESF